MWRKMLVGNLIRTAWKSSPRLYVTPAKSRSVLDRYKSKLQRKAKEAGVSSFEELKEILKDEISIKKKEMNSIGPLKNLEPFEREQTDKLEQRKVHQKEGTGRDGIDLSNHQAPYKTLSSFVDVEKVRKLPQKELKFIWKAMFEKIDRAMSAALTGDQFGRLFANAFKNPSFVVPLPKDDQGYEMHFVQWSFVGPQTTHCMLTSLAEYKLHKEYAKPHTTLIFHQELLGGSNVVLMNGKLEQDAPLSMEEALLLVLNVQRFYGLTQSSGLEKKLGLLRAFTLGDSSFSMEKLIDEAASLD